MTRNMYLGQPGAMQLIPPANAPADIPLSRADQIFVGANGVTTRTSLLYGKRNWTIPYIGLGEDDVDLLDAFYEGDFGNGPFRLVDPSRRNVLPTNTASFGLRTTAPHGWIAGTGGTLVLDAAAPPVGVLSGVMSWAMNGGDYLFPGINATHCDVTTAPVYLPLEHTSLGVWMKADAPIAFSSALRGYSTTTGLMTGVLTNRTCNVTTTWQKFNLTLSPGSTADHVLPRITVTGSFTPGQRLFLAGAQLEYNDTATAFRRGAGSPQVNITQSLGHSVDVLGRADKTLVMAEAA